MNSKTNRLFFIDAMRACAILMMLQGHFIEALLAPALKNESSYVYFFWNYFRGVTAPLFFTVSGFIFTYLLLKKCAGGWQNPRVRKGIRRGIQLVLLGHFLQLYIPGVLAGSLNSSFYVVHVLQCIGVSLILIVGIYLISFSKRKYVFPALLFVISMFSFVLKTTYDQWNYSFLPSILANYFTEANGSVFTIFPWFGYAAFGGFLAVLFKRYGSHVNFYPMAIGTTFIIGASMIYIFSNFFLNPEMLTDAMVARGVHTNNYLFIRLGDVLVAFAVFMSGKSFLRHDLIDKIGSNTLSIFVVHSIVLYGSVFGYGLTRYLYHSLSLPWTIAGAALFLVGCTGIALMYEKYMPGLRQKGIAYILPIRKFFVK